MTSTIGHAGDENLLVASSARCCIVIPLSKLGQAGHVERLSIGGECDAMVELDVYERVVSGLNLASSNSGIKQSTP